ncbi:IS110 family transposase, partial [Klebsiella pneumoniae]|uniref:IS110 family transposase n=1 Tax=Klebsiella pneumoniae TaxID=573 RepID=UPI0011579063
FAGRINMRFVPIKSLAQQDVQCLHRSRERIIKARTSLVNQIRGLLAEYGIIIARNVSSVRSGLPLILEDAENGLSPISRECFAELLDELHDLDRRAKMYEGKILEINKQNEVCQRLNEILGVGPMIATAVFAAAGDGNDFQNGRHFSSWLGLVPRQHSSGGKSTLLGISKRGNTYIRTLLIHGARAVLRVSTNKKDRLSRWAQGLLERRGHNRACVALANKLARVIWVIMARNERYRVQLYEVKQLIRKKTNR